MEIQKNSRQIPSSDKITATVDLSEYTEAGTYTVRVTVSELPAGCTYIGEATIQIILSKK